MDARNLGELGIELQKIITRLMANQNLLKLLYYTGKDPLSEADLTSEQIKNEFFEKLIKVVPRVGPKETAQSLIALQVINGIPNRENNEFNIINFNVEVFVPLTQWMIKDSNLRPFAIMGEITKTLSRKTINGLGRIIYEGFEVNFLTDEISCYEMTFSIENYD